MKSRLAGSLSLLTLILSVIWLVLLITDRAAAGPMDTYEQVLTHVSNLNALFYITYFNAALITLAASLLFAVLYVYLKPYSATLAMMGLVFVPVYAVMNLSVYLSQISIVPALIVLQKQPELTAGAVVLLREMIQQWPASGASFFNNLGYAVLGIPSILYGYLLTGRGGGLKWGGLLLVLNGAACMLGAAGSLLGSRLLASGSLAGGVLFLAALFPISAAFLRRGYSPV
jgi:hypothetical protein